MISYPPLAAVRAFEASARHLSFTRAADELSVTQSAISRHVRQLEAFLQLKLFIREHRGLRLTPEGERYQLDLADIFRRLAWATHRVKAAARGEEVLHVHSYSTFATFWLLPRMARFQRENPDIDLQLMASTGSMAPTMEVHAVISNDPGPYPESLRLFNVAMVPVCSPEYRERWLPTGDIEELSSAYILHSLAGPFKWQTWLQGIGRNDIDLNRGLRLESSVMAYNAAENGLGITIAQPEFITEKVQRGELVLPYPSVVSVDRAYYFATTPNNFATRAVKRFREWLCSELESQKNLDGVSVLTMNRPS